MVGLLALPPVWNFLTVLFVALHCILEVLDFVTYCIFVPFAGSEFDEPHMQPDGETQVRPTAAGHPDPGLATSSVQYIVPAGQATV